MMAVPIHRICRSFLLLLAISASLHGAALKGRPQWVEASSIAVAETTIIGESQRGRPLVVHHLGSGATPLFILGGQHGGPEANTVQLVKQLLAHFEANPHEIPPNARLDILLEGNPDGLAAGSRQFASGVDPNRNWGGPEWQSDAADSNGTFRIGLGGPEPFSEPETQALRSYLMATRPAFVINYHSRGGFILGGRAGTSGALADAFATASGYHRPTPGGGTGLGYRATGSMNVWMGTEGLGGILVELTTSTDPEFARNLAGIRAVLALLAE